MVRQQQWLWFEGLIATENKINNKYFFKYVRNKEPAREAVRLLDEKRITGGQWDSKEDKWNICIGFHHGGGVQFEF